uniref:Palmitoyltransferase n=1 Tax=Globisporangium ultimum (strain ATCC 200006 / CBS 805.95 / DAOM BR144) TaxID=431595 RepID=K3WQW4_GLOUD
MPKKTRDGDGHAAAATQKERRALRALHMTPTSTSSTTAASESPTVYSSSSSAPDDDDDGSGRSSEHDAFLRSSVSTLSSSPPSSSSSNGRHNDRRTKSAKHKKHHHHHHRRFQDLEYGGDCGADRNSRSNENDTSSDNWRVLHELAFNRCLGGSLLQVVHLKHANFSVQLRKDDDGNAAVYDASTTSTPTCMVGPHWWLMATTFTVFMGLALVITVLTYPRAGFGETITGVLLSSACLSMYAMVGCSNPGIVNRIDVAPDDTYSYCDHCESYRPQGALHCMDCRVCIEGYDHHCPWTGKCVGRGNVRYFYAWLFFLVLAFVYEVIEFTTYMMPPEDQPSAGYYDDFTFAPKVNG